jgi:hypothetical protein
VSPLVWQVGQALAPLTIRGKNFQNTQQVRVLPPEGITIGTPAADGTGGTITVSLSAAAAAALGPRAVVVDTVAGSTSTTPTASNTITLASTAGSSVTPILAPAVGVVLLEAAAAPVSTLIDPIFAVGVGVLLESAPQPVTQPLLVSGAQLGVALGPVATRLQPPGVLAGTSGTLVVDGSSLADVSSVTLVPGDGVTFGAPLVNAGATQLSVPISVAADAPEGWRGIRLSTATGSVPFVDLAQTQIYIAATTPSLNSISPILAAQGTVITLTINGQGLQAATAVTATPSQGITIGTPAANASGTQLTVAVQLAPDAPLVDRVIQVSTPVGASSATASPANTLRVIAP